MQQFYKKMSDLIVKSKLKEAINKLDLNCSSDVADRLDVLVQNILEAGSVRAKANGRKTLSSKDL